MEAENQRGTRPFVASPAPRDGSRSLAVSSSPRRPSDGNALSDDTTTAINEAIKELADAHAFTDAAAAALPPDAMLMPEQA